MKNKNYQYWIDQFDNGRDDHESSHIQMGKALWALHGPKGLKQGQLWKTDPEAHGLTKFADYCARKWPTISSRHISRWMAAYETAKVVFEAERPIGHSDQVQTTCKKEIPSESVLRPMTSLKTDAEKQRAWRIANENKTGDKVTARDTAEAVKEVQVLEAQSLQEAKQMAKEIHLEMRTEKELHQYATEGISTKDAYLKIHASWQALIKGEDDERAIDKLARMYIEYLSDKYSITS